MNTSQTGTYILEYTKTDAAGNQGNTVIRSVTVVDSAVAILKNASSTSLLNVSSNMNLEIGAIAIESPMNNSRLQEVTFSNIGTAVLDDIIV